MTLISPESLVEGNFKGGLFKKMSKKRISQFIESSDESEQEDNIVVSEHESPVSYPISNTHDLNNSSASEELNIQQDERTAQTSNYKEKDALSPSSSFRKRKVLKKRVVALADSSEDSDIDNDTLNSFVESKMSATATSEKFVSKSQIDVADLGKSKLPFSDEDEEFEPSANLKHKKKSENRFLKLAESSDSSDCENEDSFSPHRLLEIPKVDEDEACTSKSITDMDIKNDEGEISDDSSILDSDDSSSSDDDNVASIRIFRNPNAAAMNSRGFDGGNDLSDNDEYDEDTPSFSIPSKPRRHAKPTGSSLEIKSETQRLIRESSVNLPYFIPEAKKVSDFLKRPVAHQEKLVETTGSSKSVSLSTIDNEPVLPDLNSKADEKITVSELGLDQVAECNLLSAEATTENKDEETLVTPATNKKAQLLASRGIDIPNLNSPMLRLASKPEKEFIDLDGEESQSVSNEVSDFMQRFLKHSIAGKKSSKKKKVQFNIIRKEERTDGTGVELVADVVTSVDDPSDETGDSLPSYKTLREKLAAKMKERRTKERLKREEIFKLDNEEIGTEADDEEEELDDEWSDIESDHNDDEEVLIKEKEESCNKLKNRVIDDEDEEEDAEEENTQKADEESLDATQPLAAEITLSNSSSKVSLPKGSDTVCSNLSREGSLLLFDDSDKKSCRSHEDLTDEHRFEAFDTSAIPLHQPEISDISDSSKPARLNFDEDSYFCSERSLNASTNGSQSRIDYTSQFLDSDGYIKESKTSKSISSLLPPGGEDDNANDCNMSQLLELCSGKFQVSEVSDVASPQVSDVETADDINDVLIDTSFGFQVEPEPFEKAEIQSNFSDGEHSDTEEADEVITIVRKKKDITEKMTRNFLEEEAELSGDDVGSDDDDNDAENDDYYEEDENDEVLPHEEVIQQQVNKVHLRQLLDEDQRDIDLLQEAFVEDDVGVKRARKFRWRNIDDSVAQDLFHSDDEVENCEDDKEVEQLENEDTQWRMMRLEREEFLDTKTSDANISAAPEADDEDSQLLKMGRTAIQRSRSRVLSDINGDSRGVMTPPLSRSSSFTTTKLPSKSSFLCRNKEVLLKFAGFKESKIIKGAVNSDRMVFKTVSPTKKQVRQMKRSSTDTNLVSKKLKLDEDSNSIFDLFEN